MPKDAGYPEVDIAAGFGACTEAPKAPEPPRNFTCKAYTDKGEGGSVTTPIFTPDPETSTGTWRSDVHGLPSKLDVSRGSIPRGSVMSVALLPLLVNMPSRLLDVLVFPLIHRRQYQLLHLQRAEGVGRVPGASDRDGRGVHRERRHVLRHQHHGQHDEPRQGNRQVGRMVRPSPLRIRQQPCFVRMMVTALVEEPPPPAFLPKLKAISSSLGLSPKQDLMPRPDL